MRMKMFTYGYRSTIATRLVVTLAAALSAVALQPAVPLPLVQAAGGQGQGQGQGQTIYRQDCASCHTIGHGSLVGPDLKGVTARRTHTWLLRWIQSPNIVLAQNDPLAKQMLGQYKNIPMPNLGLTQAQVEAIIAYLQAQSGQEAPPQKGHAPAPAPAAPLKGNPAIGKALFTGDMALQNGGSPCIACHNMAGAGSLGGGVVGPDLTQAYHKYGGAGLAAVLANIPFPTMRPIFDGRALTPAEQAHLVAFFKQAQQAPPPSQPSQDAGQLAMLAGSGVIVLLLLMDHLWRRRLVGVRRSLVARRSGDK